MTKLNMRNIGNLRGIANLSPWLNIWQTSSWGCFSKMSLELPGSYEKGHN